MIVHRLYFATSTFSNFFYDAEARQTYQQYYILPLNVADFRPRRLRSPRSCARASSPCPLPIPTKWRAGTRSLSPTASWRWRTELINTAPPGDDSSYICFTGSVTAAGTCKINRCDLQTTHSPPSAMPLPMVARCYHTCYRL